MKVNSQTSKEGLIGLLGESFLVLYSVVSLLSPVDSGKRHFLSAEGFYRDPQIPVLVGFTRTRVDFTDIPRGILYCTYTLFYPFDSLIPLLKNFHSTSYLGFHSYWSTRLHTSFPSLSDT